MLYELLHASPALFTTAAITVFLLGAAVGSFMEVVRVRCSWSKTLFGRSYCAKCKKTLHWYELLPLVSYVAQKGKCKECFCSIPIYHIASEVITGLLFVAAFLFSNSLMMAGIICISAIFLVPLVLSDIERMEVPEHLSLPFAYLTLGIATVTMLENGTMTPVINGMILATPFYLIWLSSAGRAMGLGDAKVALSLGFLLPSVFATLSVFLLTFWVGILGLTLYALHLALTKKKKGKLQKGMRVPLIPSMAIAFYIILFINLSYMDLLLALQ